VYVGDNFQLLKQRAVDLYLDQVSNFTLKPFLILFVSWKICWTKIYIKIKTYISSPNTEVSEALKSGKAYNLLCAHRVKESGDCAHKGTEWGTALTEWKSGETALTEWGNCAHRVGRLRSQNERVGRLRSQSERVGRLLTDVYIQRASYYRVKNINKYLEIITLIF
jgi:hypothetical protein